MLMLLNYSTIVPMFSPLTTLTIFSGFSIANTLSGILLSIHNEVAVESITFKSWFNISIYEILSYLTAVESIFGSAE